MLPLMTQYSNIAKPVSKIIMIALSIMLPCLIQPFSIAVKYPTSVLNKHRTSRTKLVPQKPDELILDTVMSWQKLP